MKFDIITIGSLVFDIFFEPEVSLIKWDKTSLNKALVFPLGGKVGSKKILFSAGGNALNAAVTFSRQGYKTAVIAKVGKDALAEDIFKKIKKESIYSSLIKTDKQLPTSCSVILLSKGERAIMNYPGANHNLKLKDINLADLKSKWWYVSLAGEAYKILPPLLEFAEKNGILVALNPSTYHLRNNSKGLKDFFKKINLLIVNEDEASLITGISFKNKKKVFKKLDEMVPSIVAVTSGSKGVSVSDGKFIYEAGIFNAKVVDRTGAGDAFGSGFVSGLMRFTKENKDKKAIFSASAIKYAISLATANAASVVEKLGANEGALYFEKQNRWKGLKIKIHKLK
ncbi:MAG: carbohydrate kinase family protein [Candidatus Liptonbacteria bacterium]|nr:carbohydrate kinase family protein [Candidatus Liptonbacteria bacterium]